MSDPENITPPQVGPQPREKGGGPCSCGHDRYAHLHMPTPDGDGLQWLGSCFACGYRCKQYDGTAPPTQQETP